MPIIHWIEFDANLTGPYECELLVLKCFIILNPELVWFLFPTKAVNSVVVLEESPCP